MVECKMPKYRIMVNAIPNDDGEFAFWIEGTDRIDSGFTDKETALEWGRRALWCLSLGE